MIVLLVVLFCCLVPAPEPCWPTCVRRFGGQGFQL